VDRVFVVQGVGTVVTGTLAGGRFRRGQTVCVQPGARVTRIRGMQSHNQDIEEAGPGRRVALNLPDLEALVGVARGDVVTTHDTGDASDTLDVVLCKSPRLMDAQVPGARPLKDGTPVRVHLGSANVAARVLLVGPAPLTAGGEALAQLRLETPLLALAGDRFIVRDASEQATLAGGFVLVPGAPRNRWRSAQNQAFLRVARTAVHSASELARAWIQLRLALRCDRLLQQSRFGADEISAGTARLIQARQAVAAGEWLVDAAWWSDLHAAAARQIEAYHASHPELPGLPLTALKSALSERVAAAGLLDLLVKDLTTQGYVVRENAIRRADFRPALPPQLERAGERLRQRLAEESLEVPSRAALAPDAMSQQALRYLVQAGEAVELGPDLVIGMAAWTRARATVRRVLRQQGRATTSELRQALGSNRRVTIPLLESLDRQGFTRREGDQRVLRADSEEAG
jgi:selenocysteine-specific elongation factor